jgi:hypothetical protein
MSQGDAIESSRFIHAEGNKRVKIGVKRGFVAFYGAKLLKKQGERTDHPPGLRATFRIQPSG